MTFGITAILSAKNLGETIRNIRGELTDIVTSQCFVEGTLIVTADGDKPIEEIQAGDLVYSTNPETGESEYKEVLRTFRKESDVLIHIFVNGEEIETTPVHPFWVEDQWVAAKDLEVGDILTLADGTTAPVTYSYGEQLDEPVIVYNFEVSDFHTYYVTDTGVLVHNANKNYLSGNNSKQTLRNRYPGEHQSGTELNYTLENEKIYVENGIQDVNFVVDMDGKVIIGQGHSFLAKGMDVQAVGTLKINHQGYVRRITNGSGHYIPTVEQGKNFPRILNDAGVRTKMHG